MKVIYDFMPSVLEAVGNGSHRYHYDIEKVEANNGSNDDNGSKKTQYECQEVIVWEPLSSNKITEAVITSKWDANYEQKLINEYNAAQLGLLTEDEAEARIKAYTDYLSERATLKAQVDNDCKQLGIE